MTAGDLEDCLITKLRADEEQGGKHRKFRIRDDAGLLVASTAMSRSWRRSTTISASMSSTIRQQLGLRANPRAFADLVDCPLTRRAYLDLVTRDTAE